MADAILTHLAAALPNEGVGLIGVAPQAPWRACLFVPGTNVDASSRRYTMHPAEVIAAFRAMAASSLRLGAIVHSHPASSPEPSATDLREAYHDNVVMIIVGLRSTAAEWKAWRITGPLAGRVAIAIPIVIDYSAGWSHDCV